MTVRTRAAFGCLIAGLLIGCVSGEDIPRIDDAPFTGPDTGPPPIADMQVESDADTADAGRKRFNERCTENAECADGWCVGYNDVDICTRRCLVGGCPEGWSCRVIGNTRPDAVSVCLPPDGRLCRPCEVDDDCPEGLCHALDQEGGVCGIDCDVDAEGDDATCPPGYTCRAVEGGGGAVADQCVPDTESCTCNANTGNRGAVRFCEVSNEYGTCRQRQACDPTAGWGMCEADTPAPELCDGADNDCNGFPDDVPGIGEACSEVVDIDGAPQTCTGVRVCNLAIGALVCSAATPTAELCNGRDDDCDEAVDETFALDQVCRPGIGACQRAGIRVCTADGAATECNVEPAEPMPELCNGVDDDCDAATDEAFPDLSTACSVGVGACSRAGLRVCAADGAAVECSARAGAPGDEACNGVDDDCDGSVDEGFAGLRTPCADGVGLCRRQGITVCSADGAAVECDAVPGAPEGEVCDRQDNDCDGATDEGYEGLGRICSDGVGACLRQGVLVCAAAGDGVQCNAEPGEPVDEICNGVDDDCDGAADEGYVGLGRICAAGTGACLRQGVGVCAAAGDAVECNAEPGEPADEICNGVDDDCDGEADEGWPTLGTACTAGEGLCRRSGRMVCDPGDPMGAVVCDAVAGEGSPVEVCDYQDDDCDGAVDEGFVDGRRRYTALEHCGACGTDCAGLWNPDPQAFGVVPRCQTVANGAQCAFDCEPGRRDADGVPNNGCELIIDDDAVYVSPPANGGADAADCGSLDDPCATIGFGLDRAEAGGRARVRVAEGIYRESVVLRPGIELLGGHQRLTWQRNPALSISIINGRTPAGEVDRWVVRAEGIDAPTVFDGFTLNGESPLLEGNAYGVYVLDSGAGLTLRDNRIFGGDGGRGRDGAAGDSGLPGTEGADGLDSVSAGQPSPCADGVSGDPAGAFPGQLGGRPGERTCGAVAVHGGRGGYTSCPTLDRQEGSGAPGDGPMPGAGGDGGWGLLSLDELRCDPSDPDLGPADPGSGANGRPGADGGGGDGALEGGVMGGHWRGASGVAGVGGTPGSGGGGGGGAGGVLVLWPNPESADFGATGGGGGSGGCPGTSGAGGTAGGGAFGIYIAWTAAAPGPEGMPTVVDNRVARGIGGTGGAGGNGGGGGEGGSGGGGGRRGDVWMDFCSFAGGEGGQGGRGGHGGGGGGGQGGPSYDVFVAAPGALPDYAAQNAFELADDVPTHGLGGRGGNSSNTAVGPGGDGADAESGNVGQP